MMNWAIKRFVKDRDNIQNSNVREAYGRVSSCMGILANIVLFIGKFSIGTMVRSVSITADAVNNLSDAGSSLISLISFKLSNKPADEEHPFGHARYEYIASMAVAVLIILLGVELIKTSFDKILAPDAIEFSIVSVAILVFAIVVKFWMYQYNKHYGKLIKSSVMEATAMDSLGDVMATSAVLLSTLISPVIHFQLDGYMGVIVACFILVSGINIIRSTLNDLLGKSPSPEFVSEIVAIIKSYEGVLGIHDLMIHDYGPQRSFASAHVEVSSQEDILKSHDMIDNIERALQERLQIAMVIHMDPIDVADEETNRLRAFMKTAVITIHPELSIHDFRSVKGETHTNLIFDCLIPYHVPLKNSEILAKLQEQVVNLDQTYYLVVTFDRAFTSDQL